MLNEKALEAAIKAYRHHGYEEPCSQGIAAAVTAYLAAIKPSEGEVREAIQWLRSSACPEPWFHRYGDLIEALTAENERLKEAHMHAIHSAKALTAELQERQQEIERLRGEVKSWRDAANAKTSTTSVPYDNAP